MSRYRKACKRLLKGDQNRNDLRADLEALHFDEQDFRREEIWKNEEDTEWLSILADLVVAGERDVVMDCIRVVKGEPSLYDDFIVRTVAEELRTGVTAYIKTHTIEETLYDGLEATGISVSLSMGREGICGKTAGSAYPT